MIAGRLPLVGVLCLAVLLSGCGISGGGDQITQMNEKYLAEQESPSPGKEAPVSEDNRQTEAASEEAGKESAAQKETENEERAVPGKEKAEKAAKKDKSRKNRTAQNPTGSPSKRRNTTDNKTSRKKSASVKKNKTSPAPGKKSPEDNAQKAEPEKNKNSVSCYISIDCKNILSHMSELKESKREFVPGDGMILNKTKVAAKLGSSAYDVLYQICREKKIHLEASYTPMYKSYYVEGIHQLYEFDCGDLSGWNYTVNGVQPSYSCSKYQVKEGDVIALRFTCNRGKDL